MAPGYYVVIRGPMAAGKSTIAQAIAKRLNAEYVSIDAMLSEHRLDEADEAIGCIPARNFIMAFNMALPRIRELLENGKTVVFDGCFYHMEQLQHLLGSLKYRSMVFTLKVPVEICIERDMGREQAHGESAVLAVYGLVSRFDYGTVVDATKSKDRAVEEILTEINKGE